ncbi:hypothetical protein MRY87_09055 [bacterium]|nr:hypothetical protein [bacterium]
MGITRQLILSLIVLCFATTVSSIFYLYQNYQANGLTAEYCAAEIARLEARAARRGVLSDKPQKSAHFSVCHIKFATPQEHVGFFLLIVGLVVLASGGLWMTYTFFTSEELSSSQRAAAFFPIAFDIVVLFNLDLFLGSWLLLALGSGALITASYLFGVL